MAHGPLVNFSFIASAGASQEPFMDPCPFQSVTPKIKDQCVYLFLNLE